MNKLQIEIINESLSYIANNHGRVASYDLRAELTEKFGYPADLDIEYTLDILIKDYQLITQLGQECLRLTLEGEKVHEIGMGKYIEEIHQDKELDKSVKTSTIRSNYFNITNVLITIIASIISTLISLGILKLIL